MKFGVQLYSLRDYIAEHGLEQALRIVAEAGFTGVEFAGFYGKSGNELEELLKRYRLTAVSAHVGIDDISAQLPVLKALDISCAIVPWLGFNKNISFQEGLEQCKRVEALLRKEAISLGYHNHDHEFLNGSDIVGRLSQQMPDLKLELDVFWLTVAGVDVLGYLDAHRDKLLYLHIKELGKDAQDFNPVLGEGRARIAEVIELGKRYGVEWSILEVEKTDLAMEEYLQRCCEFIKKCK